MLSSLCLIGISCDEPHQESSFQSPKGLSFAITKAGGIPLLLSSAIPPAKIVSLIQKLDGLVIAGGAFDLPPAWYGEKKRFRVDPVQKERALLERKLIRTALKLKKPLLGICGGMQALNVVLGGTLYQDLTSQVFNAAIHEKTTKQPKPSHYVELAPHTQLLQWIQKKRFLVNSSHHQAVKKLGKGLVACALSPEDGLIEAIELKNGRAWGVQWHPEALRDASSSKLFKQFVRECRSPTLKSNSNKRHGPR